MGDGPDRREKIAKLLEHGAEPARPPKPALEIHGNGNVVTVNGDLTIGRVFDAMHTLKRPALEE